MARLKNTYIAGSCCVGTSKSAWNDGIAGAYIGYDGTIHLTHATKGGYIGFHWAGNTDADFQLKQTGATMLNTTSHFSIGSKNGYLDGKTGFYFHRDGYMHLQRDSSSGNPYIGFIRDTNTEVGASIGLVDGNILAFIASSGYRFSNTVYPSSDSSISCGQNSYRWSYVYANYIGVGSSTYNVKNGSVFAYWKDGLTHDLIQRNTDGLTLNIGWIGSSTYSTKVILQAQAYKLGSASGTTISSDKNLKKDFNEYDDKFEKFYMGLKPITYKYKLGTSGRTHCGFITQDVEDALKAAGMTTQDFGGVNIFKLDHRDTEVIRDDSGNEIGEQDIELSPINYLLDQGLTEEHDLIYSEFISLNTHMIQKLMGRMAELENKIKILEEKLSV